LSIPQRIEVAVRDCPRVELLRRLCQSLQCELWVDSGVEGTVTMTLIDRDVSFILGQALDTAGYIITWKGEGREIESIVVFKDSLRDRLSRLDAERPEGESGSSAGVRPEIDRATGGALFKRLEELYRTAPREDEREAVLDFVSGITSRAYEPELIRVSQEAGSPPTAFQRAAIRALANMGTATAVNSLLDRLEHSGGLEGESLTEDIRNMAGTPASLAALRYAASGGKRFLSPAVRVAAVQSLARFQDRQTLGLLTKLAAEAPEPVKAASVAALAGDIGEEEGDDE
jgi:HEAT repeat protein